MDSLKYSQNNKGGKIIMKKFDFIRIFFLVISILILTIGVLAPESNLTASIIGVILIFAVVVLDKNSAKIAKLSEDNPKVKTMRLISRSTICIVIICSFYYTLLPLTNNFSTKSNNTIIIGLVSLFIMFFGNISPKIPFNRYVGLRLPWTIRDEDTWKIAHRILGYISFPLAIIMFIPSFYFDVETIATTSILIWILIPGLYSLYFYYKKFKKLTN